MLHRPKKRSCPSLSCSTCVNMRRQPPGDKNGNRPSNTRTRASASQMVSLAKRYFLAGLVAGAGAALPRMALKNSDEDGSSTMTSLFLLKLAL